MPAANVGPGRIARGERTRVAEDLGQPVNDSVEVVAEWIDELRPGAVIEVTDELGRACRVVEEVLEGSSVEDQLHDPIVGHFDPIVRLFCRALSGIRLAPSFLPPVQLLETTCMTKGPEKRDRKLSIRLSSSTLERLRKVAMLDKRAMSDWALVAVEDAIERAEVRHSRAKGKPKAE